MNNSPKLVVSLCPQCSECPTVEVYEDRQVRIGEAPQIATLDRGQWNELVRAIKSGALKELA